MRRDFEPDERDFLTEIDASLKDVRAVAGPCPHPDLVMAAAADVQTESSASILEHVKACPVCQQLIGDFSEYEHPPVSEEEDRRIRARWERPNLSLTTPARQRMRLPYVIGAAAALVLVAAGLFLVLRQGGAPQNLPSTTAGNKGGSEPPPTVQPAKARTAFVLSKAAIKVPASAVLTLRSGSNDERAFLDQFASALAPYRSDDFAEAARRLEQLAAKYPESTPVQYYLGVSRLFLNQNSEALESLETAGRLAADDLRDDVTWYLALALDRAGRLDDARREVGTLCSRSGEFQKQACTALEELK